MTWDYQPRRPSWAVFASPTSTCDEVKILRFTAPSRKVFTARAGDLVWVDMVREANTTAQLSRPPDEEFIEYIPLFSARG